MSDWADQMARTIADDFSLYEDEVIDYHGKLRLVAMRLRVIEQQGVCLGIDQVAKELGYKPPLKKKKG